VASVLKPAVAANLDVRRARDVPVFHFVVRALQVIEGRCDDQRRPIRRALERQRDARDDAAAADVAHGARQLGIEPRGIGKGEQRSLRIRARNDQRRGNLLPARQRDTRRASLAYRNPGDRGSAAHLDARHRGECRAQVGGRRTEDAVGLPTW
jgi:hypothetical protein